MSRKPLIAAILWVGLSAALYALGCAEGEPGGKPMRAETGSPKGPKGMLSKVFIHRAVAKIPEKWVTRDKVDGKIIDHDCQVLEDIAGKVNYRSQKRLTDSILKTTIGFYGVVGQNGEARIKVTVYYITE